MSLYRQQALIEAPPEVVWELLGNPNRHPEWWPRVVDVHCDGLEQGCTYRQVTKSPKGIIETDISVETLDDCREINMRCLDTGTCSRWLFTEAQGNTFVEAEFGMDPHGIGDRVFDLVAGRRYFRRWMEQSLDALQKAARAELASPAA
jgi:Polyketide cyclase / dehydrase and lipid transport